MQVTRRAASVTLRDTPEPYPGTRYLGEQILVHEISHSIQGSLRRVDPALHAELEAAYREATERERYITARGTCHYAVNTLAEYRAEATQWWFWSNYPEVFVRDVYHEGEIEVKQAR